MSTYTKSNQSAPTDELSTETVDARSDGRMAAGRREISRSPSTSSSASKTQRAYRTRRRLTTTYIQGDFAAGQRTLPLPVAPVGTFATQ